MLTPEQLDLEVKITAGNSLILLQCLSRLASLQNGIRDVELKTVGETREALVAGLQETTGVNFDQARAAQQAALQQRMLEERAAQAQAAQEADSAEVEDAPAEEEEPNAAAEVAVS